MLGRDSRIGTLGWRLAMVIAAGLAAPVGAQTVAEPVKKDQPESPAPALDAHTDAKPAAAPASAASTQDPEAKAKIEALADKLKTLKSLSFTVHFSVEGRGKEIMGPVESKVVAVRNDKGWAYRTTGKGKRTPKQDWFEFDIAYANGNASWLDKDVKKLLSKPVASARGKMFDAASNLRSLSELFLATPLTKERAAKDIALRESEKVDGVECDVIVAPGTPGGDAILYLGKDDHLPRKIVRERGSTAGSTSMVLEFKDLKIDEKIEASAVEIALPEGFTKDEPPAARTSKPAQPKPSGPSVATPTEDIKLPIEPKFDEDGRLIPDGPGTAVPLPPGGPHATPHGPDAPPAEGTHDNPTAPTDSATKPTGTSPTPNTPAPVAEEAHVLPAFDLKTSDGKSITAESLKGQTTVIMFFGTWSLTSKKALPELKAMADRYKDKAKIYAAAVRQRDSKAATKAATDAGVESPVILEADKLADQLKVGAFPAFFVISPDGEILSHPKGATLDALLANVRGALDAAFGMTPAPKPTSPATEPMENSEASPAETSK